MAAPDEVSSGTVGGVGAPGGDGARGETTGAAAPTRRPAGPATLDSVTSPARTSVASAATLPESFRYRIKQVLLGPPLTSENLSGQRVGKPTALAVLSSDVMSSSAYATEEILRILVPIGGAVAFSLVTPITGVILAVLAVVTICYREVIKSYPKAGGSYVVSRDNFGPNVAQIAGAALLISYTITVAVSVAAGTDAIISVFPALNHTVVAVPVSIAFIVLIAFGNLRGIREAGRVFAVPTYLFIANMAVLIVTGLVRELLGNLPRVAAHARPAGTVPFGHSNSALLFGVGAFYLLKAFANGGSAMTGTEAISNGVSVFRAPQARNARATLTMMSCILGAMFLGVSSLAALTHVAPTLSGTPTVVSEIGKLVYGTSALGRLLFYVLQTVTALILVLAANTSFTGFPFLVSFVAEDSFLPRKLTIRGHRLVFSNGILVLATASILLIIATGSKVSALIPMYAIGVFTGFTMAGAGMVKHHLTHRAPGWHRSVVINGIATVVCLIVVAVFAVTEFKSGAWVVVIVMPLLVYGLIRTNRQYRTEDSVLEEGAAVTACEAPVLRRHVVVVLVDRIDLAVARAIQYARALSPDDLRAVHFNIDERRTDLLTERWKHLGLSRLPLDVVECRDRRIGRACLELASDLTDGQTEVTLLLPRRSYRRAWGRLLHDQTADKIVEVVSQLAHVNATIVPFQMSPAVGAGIGSGAGAGGEARAGGRARDRVRGRAGTGVGGRAGGRVRGLAEPGERPEWAEPGERPEWAEAETWPEQRRRTARVGTTRGRNGRDRRDDRRPDRWPGGSGAPGAASSVSGALDPRAAASTQVGPPESPPTSPPESPPTSPPESPPTSPPGTAVGTVPPKELEAADAGGPAEPGKPGKAEKPGKAGKASKTGKGSKAEKLAKLGQPPGPGSVPRAGGAAQPRRGPTPSAPAEIAARQGLVGPVPEGTIPISEVAWRRPARVAGRIRQVRVQPSSGAPTLECSLVDGSGEALTIVFMGRQSVAGIRTGTNILVEGVVGKYHHRLAIVNPNYELLSVPDVGSDGGG